MHLQFKIRVQLTEHVGLERLRVGLNAVHFTAHSIVRDLLLRLRCEETCIVDELPGNATK